MTPLWSQRHGREAPRPRWALTDQKIKLPKCPNAVPRQPLPTNPPRLRPRKPITDYGPLKSSVIGLDHWGEPGFPRASGYHARHAEESPVRPRIVTVVRPCGKQSLRKISLLLNRRAVQTFEQLMADVSEALGFPRCNNARIRRLFSPAGREIHSLSDFFRIDHAFLAFGVNRPSLDEVHTALNELYPENPKYCEHLLRIWDRILRPKATKADSGFHDDEPGGEGHLPTVCNQHLNQLAANNLQPVGGQGRQRDKAKKERQRKDRELWVRKGDQQKEDLKEPKKEERKAEPVYCRSCRGCGPPIPPIRSKPHYKPNNPSDANNTSENTPHRTLKADEHVANPNSVDKNLNNPFSTEAIFETPQQAINNQEAAKQRNFQANLPPDGAEVTLEDIERCYDIGRVVGDGNFAVVRECRVHGVPEIFAMKIVDNAKLQGRGHMIKNEISLLRSLEHPRLIQLFRSHHTDTHVYLLMELVTGGDLFDAISQNGRFNEPSAACMIRDISQALEYIHDKSIAHRDIKPENLLVQRHGNGSLNLKLADFGLAMVITEPVFTVCGTPTYVAPEILAETGYGVEVDIWAMGVILFVLLSGFPPFRSPERNQEELFCLIQKGDVHFLSPYWDNVSEGAKALVRALLEVDPKKRLTANQTLQHDWLQHATAQKDHKGSTQATEATIEKPNHQILNRQMESQKDNENTLKPDISAEKSLAADVNKYRIKNKHKPDINAHDTCHKISSDQQHSSTTNRQHSIDQHKPDRPAEREDATQNKSDLLNNEN
ncbi:serine/threonine-protein kinase DCLK3 [Misgurnus anguillicaudatus]|uniref:serine/threonine-protein kinase DCLK3 n=1 Tax=Misgurnus anguillicaudatus TaxID=75329 RepID=UPI003CCF7E6E